MIKELQEASNEYNEARFAFQTAIWNHSADIDDCQTRYNVAKTRMATARGAIRTRMAQLDAEMDTLRSALIQFA